MPIYEYECLTCAHRFDEIQKFSDAPIEKCPKCTNPVRKLIFAAAVIFKGSGFYATEYGKSKQNNPSSAEGKAEATKSDSKSEAKTDSKSDSKSDSKPETKSESKSDSSSKTSEKSAAS